MHKLGYTLQICHQLLHSACTQGAVSIAKHLKQIPLFVTKSTVVGIISVIMLLEPKSAEAHQ